MSVTGEITVQAEMILFPLLANKLYPKSEIHIKLEPARIGRHSHSNVASQGVHWRDAFSAFT